MKTDIESIVFAVTQAKETEAFGFSRNHCCRNLKTALDHYWRRKTLKLGQKARIPRSKAAQNLPLRQCRIEHTAPVMVIVHRLMDMNPLTTESVTELLRSFFVIRLVTAEEDDMEEGPEGNRETLPVLRGHDAVSCFGLC